MNVLLCAPMGLLFKAFFSRSAISAQHIDGTISNCEVVCRTGAGEFVSHQIELESSEELQVRKLRGSTRRNIQRADREEVEIQHLDSLDAMDIFYSPHCRTRRRYGLPPQPRRFFHLIHKYLIDPGSLFTSLARFTSKWIAGSVSLRFEPSGRL